MCYLKPSKILDLLIKHCLHYRDLQTLALPFLGSFFYNCYQKEYSNMNRADLRKMLGITLANHILKKSNNTVW